MAGAVIFANSLAAFAGSETAETVVIAPRLDALRNDVFFAVVAFAFAVVPRTPRVAAAIGIVVIARIATIFVVVCVPLTAAVLNREVEEEEAPRYRCVALIAIAGLPPTKLASFVNRPNPSARDTHVAIAVVPRRLLPMCDAIVVLIVVVVVVQ